MGKRWGESHRKEAGRRLGTSQGDAAGRRLLCLSPMESTLLPEARDSFASVIIVAPTAAYVISWHHIFQG